MWIKSIKEITSSFYVVFQNNLMYTSVGLKICQYLCLQMKIICQRSCIITPFTFWNECMLGKWNVISQAFKNNRIY